MYDHIILLFTVEHQKFRRVLIVWDWKLLVPWVKTPIEFYSGHQTLSIPHYGNSADFLMLHSVLYYSFDVRLITLTQKNNFSIKIMNVLACELSFLSNGKAIDALFYSQFLCIIIIIHVFFSQCAWNLNESNSFLRAKKRSQFQNLNCFPKQCYDECW